MKPDADRASRQLPALTDRDKPGLDKLVDKFEQVLLELVGFNFVLGEQGVAGRLKAGIRLKQLPQAHTHFIQAKISGIGQIENDPFAANLLEQGIGREAYALGKQG